MSAPGNQSGGPTLVELLCPNCQYPIPAQPDEVAWVCAQCGQASLLDENQAGGLLAIQVHYAGGIASGSKGRPFWVVDGQVRLQRETYSGNRENEALQFWGKGRRFFVPAFRVPLEQMVSLGMDMVTRQPALQEGQPAWFLPITVGQGDVRPLAEFIVLGVEAGRSDKLRSVAMDLQLGAPELWILP